MKLIDLYDGNAAMLNRLSRRFWYKVSVSDVAECWEWQASRTVHRYGYPGYGRIGVALDGRNTWMVAHRVAYLLERGEIADGLFVCHSCDNPPCCNPNHLFLGSAADNARDRDKKGRYGVRIWPSGEGNPHAALTDSEVVQIRQLYVPRVLTRPMLAERFGVSVACVDRVLSGDTYAEVAGAPLRPKKPMPALRTHCPNGHLHDKISNGVRICTKCQRAASRRYRERNRQVAHGWKEAS